MRNGQNDQITVNCVKYSFFHKISKYAKKTKNKVFYIFAGMMSLTPDSEPYNFVRTDHNTIKLIFHHKSYFSIKSLKLCHKNRGEFLASTPL